MQNYLRSTDIIDWKMPAVFEKAKELAHNAEGDIAVAKACFEFVRDKILHSWDYKLNPVTIKASDVLAHGTGYCWAKSHLLAALLRANSIPAGLCYQRLLVGDDGIKRDNPFCLHGLNAVFLREHGWYRIDARGNKTGVDAHFAPPAERMAYYPKAKGEADLHGVLQDPVPIVVEVLSRYDNYLDVRKNLPDVEIK